MAEMKRTPTWGELFRMMVRVDVDDPSPPSTAEWIWPYVLGIVLFASSWFLDDGWAIPWGTVVLAAIVTARNILRHRDARRHGADSSTPEATAGD